MHEIYDKCAPKVKFVKLDACGEDMIPLSFAVKPDGQAQIVPNQSVKASYTIAHSFGIGAATVLQLRRQESLILTARFTCWKDKKAKPISSTSGSPDHSWPHYPYNLYRVTQCRN